MKRHHAAMIATAFALIAAGCNRTPAGDGDLARDLQTAGASSDGLSLAPDPGHTSVVSAEEQTPEARQAPQPSAPTPRPVARQEHTPAPRAAAPKAVATAPVSATPVSPAPQVAQVPRPVDPPAAAPVPRQTDIHPPAESHVPAGGYSTEAEVLGHAPMPITP